MMAFSAVNFRIAIKIAEEFGLNRDVFIMSHLAQLDLADREIANYVMDANSPYAPCEDDHDCSICGFSPICVVKEKPRNANIIKEIEAKYMPDFEKLGASLAGVINDLENVDIN